MSELRRPKFSKPDGPAQALEIDMWEVAGPLADGEWNSALDRAVQEWVSRTKFKGTATLWSTVATSVNFGHRGNSCFIALSGFPESAAGAIYAGLKPQLSNWLRISESVVVHRDGGWRPRLHVQDGATWIECDDVTWISVD